MALTDTFVKGVKPSSKSGEKYSDGGGLYLLVKESGKYWRMNYRFGGKQKTLALGVYPAVIISQCVYLKLIRGARGRNRTGTPCGGGF